jgi:hypothetical protein
LTGVFGDHPGIEWASSPEDVIALAMKNIGQPLRIKSQGDNETSTSLRQIFSSSNTVDKFEASLITLTESVVRK